ncbi:MAG: efflux RND transporter permease subunit [Dehalococcoidia bacterium]
MSGFTRMAIERAGATSAVFLALAIAGWIAFRTLPINQFPSVDIPVVTITTIYPGANPREMEIQVTRPLEDAVAGLNDIDIISSTSGQGFSAVTIQFKDSADSTTIAPDVERRISGTVAQFPTGAERPTVTKINFDQLPVMQLAVYDDVLLPEQLYQLAKDQVIPRIEQINGVSQVELVGGRKQEVRVAVDPGRLAAYGLSLSQVQQALAAANTAIPGGSITQGPRQFELEVTGLFDRPEDLARVVVAPGPVRVGDLATVSQGATELTQTTRVNGKQAILVAIGQQSGSNLTDVTDAVRAAMPEVREILPASSELVVVQDTTPFVRASLLGIQEELLFAIVLTSAILLLFLHNARAAGIVLLSIPTTLLTTFVLMELMGFSLNFLSMLGLTLTIGILVDDSIVVLENILRHLARGERPFEAALMGRAEIGMAAIAITLVDVVVFAPTGLVSGQIGGFFKEFGFTIAGATLVSLLVSFTLTPLLAARIMKPGTEETNDLLGRFGARWDRMFERVEHRYRDLLSWSLGSTLLGTVRVRGRAMQLSFSHAVIVIGVAFASIAAGMALLATGLIAVEFVPNSDYGYFQVNTETPPGTSLEAHDAAMRQVEQILLDMPEVKTVTASVGVSSGGVFGSGSTGQARYGSVTVETVPKEERDRDIWEIVDDARERLAVVPGVRPKVGLQDGGPGGGQAPVSVRLSGPEFGALSELADQVQASLEQAPGLVNVVNGAPVGQPQLQIEVDQLRAAELGVSSAQLGLLVRTAFAGAVATKYQQPDGTLQDVRLRLEGDARASIASVGDLPVQTATGQTVKLSQVARITETFGPTQVNRYDRERVVSVNADLQTGYSLGEVQPDVQRAIDELVLPPGYRAEVGGVSEEQAESFGQLFLALGASVLLAYLLMAILYNSLLDPLVILFSLPVAIGGALFGLFFFGYDFSVFSMIGLILLVGLAIKNGILLVDRTKRNREHGLSVREALLEAGPARLRAILMTSLTIAIALMPTAFQLGEGAELRAPLAATVIGGIISSTMLTLVFVPVMYTLLNGLSERTMALQRAVLGRAPVPADAPANLDQMEVAAERGE